MGLRSKLKENRKVLWSVLPILMAIISLCLTVATIIVYAVDISQLPEWDNKSKPTDGMDEVCLPYTLLNHVKLPGNLSQRVFDGILNICIQSAEELSLFLHSLLAFEEAKPDSVEEKFNQTVSAHKFFRMFSQRTDSSTVGNFDPSYTDPLKEHARGVKIVEDGLVIQHTARNSPTQNALTYLTKPGGNEKFGLVVVEANIRRFRSLCCGLYYVYGSVSCPQEHLVNNFRQTMHHFVRRVYNSFHNTVLLRTAHTCLSGSQDSAFMGGIFGLSRGDTIQVTSTFPKGTAVDFVKEAQFLGLFLLASSG